VVKFTVSPAAEDDILSILVWTHEHFGERARLRYEALISQAICDVAAAPERPGSATREEIALDARSYHLFHSRRRVEKAIGRVRRPRHFLIYRYLGDAQIEIGRVLHDSMDLQAHLPQEYLRSKGDPGK
jgi:toxin ParE1/3/4